MAEELKGSESEQTVYDAWQRWSVKELPRRRLAADHARGRALKTNDEVLWQHAEQIERGYSQLHDMMERQDPYFARIRGRLEESNGERFDVDLRVHRYHRSDAFPLVNGGEMIDISHLAPLSDLVRNPAQETLTLPVSDRRFLGRDGGSPQIRVIECEVEDIELKGERVVRTAPRYGAIFEDRVKNRLSQSALPALEILADVLDREQNAMISARGGRRRAVILDGPAGTGKTVVAAHRVAVSEDPESSGLYVTPTATLRDYVKPALPRLGIEPNRARVYALADLVAMLWPDWPWEPDLTGVIPDSSHSGETWSQAFERYRKIANARALYREAKLLLDGTWSEEMGVADVAPSLWLAAWMGKSLPLSQPRWIIVDEAQSIPLLAYRAMAQWLGPKAHWVLAGDLMQRGAASRIAHWDDIQTALGLRPDQIGRLWLSHNYRVPVNIHAAAERLRKAIMPDSEDSQSVPWHPHLGEVKIGVMATLEEMAQTAEAQVDQWHRQGLSAIALLAPATDQMGRWETLFTMPWQRLNGREPYRGGTVLTTLDLVRGLEFDAVVLLEVSQEAYPDQEESARALYTAITRARRFVQVLVPLDRPSPWIQYLEKKA